MQMGPQMGQVSPEEQKEQMEFMQGVTKLYNLTVGKYDVICVAGPNYTTKRQEASEQMMQLLQSFPDAAPVIGDLIAKNLDWPGAEEIAERLKAMQPQNPEVQELRQQLQEQDKVLEQGQAQADMKKADAEAAKAKAEVVKTGTQHDLNVRQLSLDEKRLAFEEKQFNVQTAQTLMQSGMEMDGAGEVVPLAPMLQQLGEGMSLLLQSLQQLAAGQQQLGEGLQQVAQIAASPRMSTLTTDAQGNKAAISRVLQ